MDFIEVTKLTDNEENKPMDLTIMLNAERQINGAPREILNYGD